MSGRGSVELTVPVAVLQEAIVSPDERNREVRRRYVQRFPGNRTVVRVNCELVGDVTLAMQRCFTDELKRSPKLVVIDLSTVTRVGGDAVDALASVAAIAGESDIPFCLVAAGRGPVQAALATRQRTELFEIFSTVNEALNSVH